MDKSRITEFHKTEPTYDFYKLFIWNNGLYGFTSVLEKSKLIRLLEVTSEEITEAVFNYNNGHLNGIGMIEFIHHVDKRHMNRVSSWLDPFGCRSFMYREDVERELLVKKIENGRNTINAKLDQITIEIKDIGEIFDAMFDEDPLRIYLKSITREAGEIRTLLHTLISNISKL